MLADLLKFYKMSQERKYRLMKAALTILVTLVVVVFVLDTE